MTSKEALQNIRDYHNETVYDIDNIYTENMFEKQLNIIEKDLDRLEELEKENKELKEFKKSIVKDLGSIYITFRNL